MKSIVRITVVLCVFSILCLSAKNSIEPRHIWVETTKEDFSDGTLENVSVTNITNGEVQLTHPMVKVVPDYQDENVVRFAAYDSNGNYLKLWVSNRNLYAQRFNSDGVAIENTFQINETQDNVYNKIYNKRIAAFLNDGHFCIGWVEGKKGMETVGHLNVQLFDSTANRVGPTFEIGTPSVSDYEFPCVVADENQRCFWFLYSERITEDRFKIMKQKFIVDSMSLKEMTPLNQDTDNITEILSSVDIDGQNRFAVAWRGKTHVYLRYFDTNFEPLASQLKLNDDIGLATPANPSICFDIDSYIIAAWTDNRLHNDWKSFDIYAQLFSPDGVRIGPNFKVNQSSRGRDAEVVFCDGSFKISWNPYAPIVNHWQYAPVTDGAYISSVFDTGPSKAQFETLIYRSQLPQKTALKVQIRTGIDTVNLINTSWYGPTDTTDFYMPEGDEKTINPVHNGDRFIQYRVLFETDTIGISPILQYIAISFTPLDTLSPNSPTSVNVIPGHSQITITWASNSESDLWKYRVYRRIENDVYDSLWTKEIFPSDTFYVDTSAVTGQKYFYSVTALDSSRNESAFSEEVPSTPFAITIWVDVNSIEGDGTRQHPFSTISRALSFAFICDTVKVLPGLYQENIMVNKKIALIGSGANSTTLKGVISEDEVVELKGGSLLKGFKIVDPGNPYCGAVKCKEGAAIITENIIFNQGSAYLSGSGIESLGDTCYIYKNFIFGFDKGIFVKPNSEVESIVLIQNNIIYSPSGNQAGIELRNARRGIIRQIIIENNTLVLGNTESNSGISYYLYKYNPSPFSAKIVNNIIVNTIGEGIMWKPESDSVKILYNNAVITQEGTPYWCTPGKGNISEDPYFINTHGLDFRLQPNSPCIDAGHPDTVYNDIDGTRNDMGVFGGPDPLDPNMVTTPFVTVSVINTSGFPGDTISVPISLSNAAMLARASFALSFDYQILSPLSVHLTPLCSSFDLYYDFSDSGKVHLLMESDKEIKAGFGNIFTVDFIVNPNLTAGMTSSLALGNMILENGEGKTLEIAEISHGTFAITPGRKNSNFLYVDGKAQEGGNGSPDNPFKTIMKAIITAVPGDTVVVSSGDYSEQLWMKEGVYLLGTGALVTKINLDREQTHDPAAVIFQGIQTGGIEGFTIMSDTLGGTVVLCDSSNPSISRNRILCPENGSCITCTYRSSPSISENNFHTGLFGYYGIGILCNNSTPSIIRNTFYPEAESSVGVNCTAESNAFISQNQFQIEGNNGTAITAEQSSSRVSNNRIQLHGLESKSFLGLETDSLLFFNNIIRGEKTGTSGIELQNGSQVQIVNNIFDTRSRGINVEGNSILVMNNIILGNQLYGVSLTGSYELVYNNVWENTLDYSSCSPGEGEISLDPLFIDRITGDYRLAIGSPCIDAGNPTSQYKDTDGSRNDMGAYGGPFAKSWSEVSKVTLALPSINVAAGDTVIIPLSVENATGLAVAHFCLSFDPQLCSVLNAWPTNVSAGFNLLKKDSTEGKVNILLSSAKGTTVGHGILANVQVAVSVRSDSGYTSPIRFDRISLKDEVVNPISVSKAVHGAISVTSSRVESAYDQVSSPFTFALSQNYPNPFNLETKIHYSIPHEGYVSLKIYNILGQIVKTLVDIKQPAGFHSVSWDGRDAIEDPVTSGIYIIRLISGGKKSVGKMLLVR